MKLRFMLPVVVRSELRRLETFILCGVVFVFLLHLSPEYLGALNFTHQSALLG